MTATRQDDEQRFVRAAKARMKRGKAKAVFFEHRAYIEASLRAHVTRKAIWEELHEKGTFDATLNRFNQLCRELGALQQQESREPLERDDDAT